jgi:hypothetical protein
MKLKFTATALAALLLAPAALPASAQMYMNVGYSNFDFQSVGADPGALTGRFGYDFNKYFAIEGEGSFGIIQDSAFVMNTELAGFVLGKLPLAESFYAYGRVGYSTITAKQFEGDGFAFGIGGQYNWGKHGLRIDWTRHDYDDGDVDALSAAYAYTF